MTKMNVHHLCGLDLGHNCGVGGVGGGEVGGGDWERKRKRGPEKKLKLNLPPFRLAGKPTCLSFCEGGSSSLSFSFIPQKNVYINIYLYKEPFAWEVVERRRREKKGEDVYRRGRPEGKKNVYIEWDKCVVEWRHQRPGVGGSPLVSSLSRRVALLLLPPPPPSSLLFRPNGKRERGGDGRVGIFIIWLHVVVYRARESFCWGFFCFVLFCIVVLGWADW